MNKTFFKTLFVSLLSISFLMGCGGEQVENADLLDPVVVKGRNNEKTYIKKDPEVCRELAFLCEEGWLPFYDQEGCGCKPKVDPFSDGENTVLTCLPVTQSVCGTVNGNRKDFMNRCFAEQEGASNITEGVCP